MPSPASPPVGCHFIRRCAQASEACRASYPEITSVVGDSRRSLPPLPAVRLMPIALVALKITLVPLLIGAITLAGRRWGPAVAGWLSGLPVVAGPIMYFMALEHGAAFASRAIVGMLLGVFAMLGFLLGYAWASTRWSWRTSLCCALSAYFAAVALLHTLDVSTSAVAILVLCVLLLAPRLFPRAELRAIAPRAARRDFCAHDRRRDSGAGGDLLCRASFGAQSSGLFSMFPVISTVLAVFCTASTAGEFTICLLRGIVFGWYAFVVFASFSAGPCRNSASAPPSWRRSPAPPWRRSFRVACCGAGQRTPRQCRRSGTPGCRQSHATSSAPAG